MTAAHWNVIADLALGALYIGGYLRNRTRLQDLHITMNSRMDELLRATSTAARAEGHAAAIKEQADKTSS
jgi:hypothetical protein